MKAFALTLSLAILAGTMAAQADEWRHSGSMYIVTTLEGANLPASAVEENFPLLVRLDKDWFDFSQARPEGQDIRFTDSQGKLLAYQIEQWDAKAGKAAIWVRIPKIRGNAQQEIRMRWGNPEAKSESDGPEVFNESSGYLTVIHMDDPVKDTVGTVELNGSATTAAEGRIGPARHFPDAGKGIGLAKKDDASLARGTGPHTTELWFRAAQANAHFIFWGGGGAAVQLRTKGSPPRIESQGIGDTGIRTNQWIHAACTYDGKEQKLYVNGQLNATQERKMDMNDSRFFVLGGWNWGGFTGELDEVRISSVARSADWLRMQYENQKPMQTLVGPVVKTSSRFSVEPDRIDVAEGEIVTIKAEVGGTRKLYWIAKRGDDEQVLAVDRFSCPLNAGRVVEDTAYTLQLKAVFPKGTKTLDIPVSIRESIPDPVCTLKAPRNWDGRETVEVVPLLENLDEVRAAGGSELHYAWDIQGMAVVKRVAPGKLVLKRAMASGPLTVTATIDNGGTPVKATATIQVDEPASDPWVQREPPKAEMPQDNQFYARDNDNLGTLYCNGTIEESADTAFMRVYCQDKLYEEKTQKLSSKKSYALSAKLKPGLVKYRVDFGTRTGNAEKILHTVRNIVCGDAYIIQGQSNAVADNGPGFKEARADFDKYVSDWVRTYGWGLGRGGQDEKEWGDAQISGPRGRLQIGYWGIMLARKLVEDHKVPICILNGSVGGTRIDQHQRNPDVCEDAPFNTIYGRLLWRARQAGLTHGVRALIWHQGEADQGSDHPSGARGWTYYRKEFFRLAASWQEDFPNIRHYYVFQIWPNACRSRSDREVDMLREEQRRLVTGISNLKVISTLGIRPPGPCHYPPEGYAAMARLICPLTEQDVYGKQFDRAVTAPNLRKACYTSEQCDEIALEFGQPMAWKDSLTSEFYLDGEGEKIASGRADGTRIVLKLKSPSTANDITYLKGESWSQDNILCGSNGVAALTFCEVPIASARRAP